MKKSELTLKPSTTKIVEELVSRFPDTSEFRTATIIDTAKALGYRYGDWKDLISEQYRIRRGTFDLSSMVVPLHESNVTTLPTPVAAAQMQSIVNSEKSYAEVDPSYVAWGAHTDIVKIIKSGMFYPTYISGLS